MAAEVERGEVSLILLSCNGEPLISAADSIQHIVVDRINLPSEMRQFPADELALQQIMGMPEGSFAVVHIPTPTLEVVPSTDEDFENNLSGELPDNVEEVKKDHSITSSVDWSHKMTLMLLDCYRIHLDEFNSSKIRKKTVWGKISLDMEQAGYGNLTWRACAKKFYNLRSTFQSMTESQRKSGCKKWPYYDLFHNILGVSSSNLSMQGDENFVRMQSVKRLRMSELETGPNNFSDILIKDESTQVTTTTEIQTISWPGEIILEASTASSLVVDANGEAAGQLQTKEFSNCRSSAASVEWTHNLTMLLLELYQAHVDDFKNDRIRKKTAWARIASGIQSAGYTGMTWEACEKKFRNLKCTYRTIVENNKNEHRHTKWPYYDIFHELFNVSDAKLLVNVGAQDQDNKHNKLSLESECKSLPVSLTGGVVDVGNSVENAWSGRKRKILPPRSLLTDFVTSFSKPENTRTHNHGNEDAKSKHCAVELLEDESAGSGVEWTRNVTMLLLALYQNHVSDFESGIVRKKTVWGRIAASLKAEGYDNMTWDVCEKKFRNLRCTYRTIMENSRSNGQCRTKWPYFDYFNNLFGQSYESSVEVRQAKNQNDSEKRHEASSGTATDCSNEVTEVVDSPKNEHKSTVTWLGTPTSLSTQHKDVENNGESASRLQDINKTPDRSAGLSFEWTRDTILSMLDLYQIHLDDFRSSKILKKKLWMQIASTLQSSGLAGNVTWDACAKKFRNLKCTYWSIAEHNKRTGQERSKWPYYKHFRQFFGSSPSTLNCTFETNDDDDDGDDFGECLQKGSVQPPEWFLSFMNEIQTAEENRFSLLQQMHAEQKQQAAEHMAMLNELSCTVRQLVDKLTSTAM